MDINNLYGYNLSFQDANIQLFSHFATNNLQHFYSGRGGIYLIYYILHFSFMLYLTVFSTASKMLHRTERALNTIQGKAAVWCPHVEVDASQREATWCPVPHAVAYLRQAVCLFSIAPHCAYSLCGVMCNLRRVPCLRHDSLGKALRNQSFVILERYISIKTQYY